jgi:plasmid stabilization system protein ParE
MKTDYRYLVCGNYLIFYKIEGDAVSVYRVLNGSSSRDYLPILFTGELPAE